MVDLGCGGRLGFPEEGAKSNGTNLVTPTITLSQALFTYRVRIPTKTRNGTRQANSSRLPRRIGPNAKAACLQSRGPYFSKTRCKFSVDHVLV